MSDYIKVVLPNEKLKDSEWISKTYDKRLKEHFPYPQLRPYQKEALVFAYDWLHSKDKEVVVVQAPTGFGKSVFAWTLARSFATTFYYTSPQLNLIEQVANEFRIPMVQGRQNFICPRTSDLASKAPCSTNSKFGCDIYCDYKRQRDAGAAADATAITPAFLLRAQQNEMSKFGGRELAIIDEAHNLPSYINDISEVTLTTRELDKLGFKNPTFPDDKLPVSSWAGYLKAILIRVTTVYEGIMSNIKNQGLNYDEDETERMEVFIDKITFVLSLISEKRPNCIIEVEERGRGSYHYTAATFKMVKAAPMAGKFLSKIANKYVFMSATILHGKAFLRELGLQENALFIDIVKSPIQTVKNGPIVIHNAAWLSKKRYDKGIDDTVSEIAKLLDIYNKEKVVIIPASHNLRADIVAKLSQRGYEKRVMTHGAENKLIDCPGCGLKNPFEGEDFIECPKCKTNYHLFERDNVLASFYSSTEPKVMVSTYLREGADLKDDLCRCLIIPKIPYPNLGDKLVKTRMAYDEEDYLKRTGKSCEYESGKGGLCTTWNCPKPCELWYRMETVKTLVQAAGRIIRSENDWGSIHILDKSWDNLVSNNRTIIPEWFMNCIIQKEEWHGKKISK
jgi:Rad3-related DNA helicase